MYKTYVRTYKNGRKPFIVELTDQDYTEFSKDSRFVFTLIDNEKNHGRLNNVSKKIEENKKLTKKILRDNVILNYKFEDLVNQVKNIEFSYSILTHKSDSLPDIDNQLKTLKMQLINIKKQKALDDDAKEMHRHTLSFLETKLDNVVKYGTSNVDEARKEKIRRLNKKPVERNIDTKLTYTKKYESGPVIYKKEKGYLVSDIMIDPVKKKTKRTKKMNKKNENKKLKRIRESQGKSYEKRIQKFETFNMYKELDKLNYKPRLSPDDYERKLNLFVTKDTRYQLNDNQKKLREKKQITKHLIHSSKESKLFINNVKSVRDDYEINNLRNFKFNESTKEKKQMKMLSQKSGTSGSIYEYSQFRTRFIRKLKALEEIQEGYYCYTLDMKRKIFKCIYINPQYFVYMHTSKKVNSNPNNYSKYQEVVKDFSEKSFIDKRGKQNSLIARMSKNKIWLNVSKALCFNEVIQKNTYDHINDDTDSSD